MTPLHGFARISELLNVVLKEIIHRSELRPRLEAEKGRPLTDEEFLTIAEEPGGMKL